MEKYQEVRLKIIELVDVSAEALSFMLNAVEAGQGLAGVRILLMDVTQASYQIEKSFLPWRGKPDTNRVYELQEIVKNELKILLESMEETEAPRFEQRFLTCFAPAFQSWLEELHRVMMQEEAV